MFPKVITISTQINFQSEIKTGSWLFLFYQLQFLNSRLKLEANIIC